MTFFNVKTAKPYITAYSFKNNESYSKNENILPLVQWTGL